MSAVSTHPGGGLPGGIDHPIAMPRSRRRTELLMLIFTVAVVAFAYANVGLGLKGQLPAGMVEYCLGFAVLVLLAHLAVRRLAPWADPLMLPLAALLNGLGIVMIYRLQEVGRNGNPGQLSVPLSASATGVQLLYTAFGIAGFILVLALIREPRVLQRYTYTFGIIGLILLAIPALLPSSISEVPGTGAKIQVAIGGFSFQPEEFGKLALAVFFARDLGPVLIAWAASLLVLVFESDIGTSALFFGMFVAMIYIATQRTSWLIIGLGLFVGGSFIASRLFSHVGERFDIW